MTTHDRAGYDRALELINTGRLSVDFDAGVVRNAQGHKQSYPGNKGYVRMTVPMPGKGSRFVYVHRVVYEAAHGPIQAGLHIDHLNSVKHDNRLSNLDTVTPAENNRRDRVRRGISRTPEVTK